QEDLNQKKRSTAFQLPEQPASLTTTLERSPHHILMPRKRGRRGRPPKLVHWLDDSPSKLMRDVFSRTTRAVNSNHPRLRRIWRIRDAWLEKGKECRGKIPPGAFRRQKPGRPIPEWNIRPGSLRRTPLARENICHIYAIVNLRNGKTYVGRTSKSPYVRLQEHSKSGDTLGKAIMMDDSKFVVVILEEFPRYFPCIVNFNSVQSHWINGGNSWIHRLDTLREGYNTRREKAKPCYPHIPSHGFGTRPVKRSRHGVRVSEINGGYQDKRTFSSRDWKRRVDYFTGLVNNKPHLVEKYISKLAPKTLLRMIKHVGQQGIPGNVQQAFNTLRKHFLKSFPPPEIKERKIPKLVVTGFTSEISNVVPLRGLFMRPNILSNIPPSCQEFRECIIKSVLCFKYGWRHNGLFISEYN
ncbi:MAG: GIY-YIG nuclease family protein, partial [Ekhidna sp.]